MSTLSQFSGGGAGIKPTGPANGESLLRQANGSNVGVYNARMLNAGCKSVTTTLIANSTLITALSVSGKGVLQLVAVAGNELVGRTHRIKITLDGTVIFDATTVASGNYIPWYAVGNAFHSSDGAGGSYFMPIFEDLIFDTSCLVEYSSSVSSTGYSTIFLRYIPR